MKFLWSWSKDQGYEVTTRGDSRFSALVAKMPDGRTIEEWYQCDIKGYNPGGTDWMKWKGKPPQHQYPSDQLYLSYLTLWRIWALHNPELMSELYDLTLGGKLLRDRFATEGNRSVNQARALAQILNEWVMPQMEN